MSDGASFVKRSKPRSSASRISSTYDDDRDAAAGPSKPFHIEEGVRNDVPGIPTSGSTTTMASRSTLSGLDGGDDDDAETAAASSSVVFRARAKGARGTPSSSTAATLNKVPAPALSQRSRRIAMDEDDDDVDDSDAFEIRRSKLSIAGRQARGSGASSTDTPKRSTPLRPTSFQAQPSDTTEASTSAPSSSMYTSKYLEELRSSTPTSRSRADSPVAIHPTGPGVRINDPMVAQTSRLALDDDALARSKFAADFTHDGIPSESVIRAAKEKRAKLRAAATAASASPAPSDDFISLAPFGKSSALKRYDKMQVDDGPHPHSRLQREEDELGDGEEEFAQFTGATERIPIGEKATKEWEARQRREMEAAVRGGYDDQEMDEVMDEDEQEWEQAQLRRTQVAHPQSRESSPYRSAPIPASIPLPTISTCSTRLQLTLRALEQSISASTAVVQSTAIELETLEAAERENKLDVAAVEEKASWFEELDEFVASLARFMEEKVGKVEEVEGQAMELVARRNRMVAKRRGRWFDRRLGVCLDVVPTKSGVVDLSDEQEDEAVGIADANHADAEAAHLIDASQLDHLSPADELSFTLAQREIVSNLTAIFADVQAAEYLDPAVPSSSSSTVVPNLPFLSPTLSADLHPRSVVSRFHEWRRLYPEEYAQTWGGLSLAQIWEFYARLELIPWCAFLPSGKGGWKQGAAAIGHFRWFIGASDYTCRMEQAGDMVGGDDEVVALLVGNVLVKHLVELVRKGGLDPWSSEQNSEAVEGVDRVQTVLGAGAARCLSLVEAVLDVFAGQIARLNEVLQLPETQSEMHADDADRIRAATELLDQLVPCLLQNLLGWSRIVHVTTPNGDASTPLVTRWTGLVESLILDVVDVFCTRAASKGLLLPDVRRQVRAMVPPNVVARSEKLSGLFSL